MEEIIVTTVTIKGKLFLSVGDLIRYLTYDDHDLTESEKKVLKDLAIKLAKDLC